MWEEKGEKQGCLRQPCRDCETQRPYNKLSWKIVQRPRYSSIDIAGERGAARFGQLASAGKTVRSINEATEANFSSPSLEFSPCSLRLAQRLRIYDRKREACVDITDTADTYRPNFASREIHRRKVKRETKHTKNREEKTIKRNGKARRKP